MSQEGLYKDPSFQDAMKKCALKKREAEEGCHSKCMYSPSNGRKTVRHTYPSSNIISCVRRTSSDNENINHSNQPSTFPTLLTVCLPKQKNRDACLPAGRERHRGNESLAIRQSDLSLSPCLPGEMEACMESSPSLCPDYT